MKSRLDAGTPPSRRALIPTFAVLAGFGVMVASIIRFPLPWEQIERISADGTELYAMSAEQSFVESRTEPGEKVLVITTPLDHRVAERAGVTNVSPGGLLASADGADRVLDSAEEHGATKLFERTSPSEPALGVILRERGFEPVATDQGSGLVLWER